MQNDKNMHFPSYKKIYNQIKDQKKRAYENLIHKFETNIHKLKTSVDFDQEHKNITTHLIESYRKDKT